MAYDGESQSRVERLSYLAAGLRQEHHERCGISPNIVCSRCRAIEEYELDRLDLYDYLHRHYKASGNTEQAALIEERIAETRRALSMDAHPSNQPGSIADLVDEIFDFGPRD
jgi:hypothetical protein